jgi:citronellol/citronellal dehydrogenase
VEDQTVFGLTDAELAHRPTAFAPNALEGKRVLVTGGGSGIGRATAWLAARLGAVVVVAGRSDEKLASFVAAVGAAGLNAQAKPLNIRDEAAVERLFGELEEGGGIDVLVNSAGGQFPQAAIDFSPKGWRAVIDTNLNGTWWMMQAAARAWRARKAPGTIVNVVTVVDRGMPGVAHTCAARAGVIYLSKTVAVEWAPLDIRINCVAPGVIASEGQAVYDPVVRAAFPMANPMKRWGSPWDVAQTNIFLASDASAFMTGEVITVDGGGCLWGELWTTGKPDHFRTGAA